jgi:hypothetical protein
MTKAGLIEQGSIIDTFVDDIDDIVLSFCAKLDPTEASQVPPMVDKARQAAYVQWQAWARGDNDTADRERLPRAEWMAVTEDDIVVPPPQEEDEDLTPGEQEEGTTAGGRNVTVGNLQKQLSVLVDNTNLRRHTWHLLDKGDCHHDLRRLRELRDPSVNHEWLHHLDKAVGRVMDDDDYIDAVRLRLGARVHPEPFVCPECGSLSDTFACHSSCCAKAERTKGHYAVVGVCLDYIAKADPGATVEPAGLSESMPQARPGDIYTSGAVPNREAALDITVVSQEAGHAGHDCVDTAYKAKLSKYEEVRKEWEGTNLVFQPMVFSHRGECMTTRHASYTTSAGG